MKIKFTKLPTNDGTIKVSLDGGQSFTDYNIADIHESGIPLDDNQDYEKIQVKAPANVLKNLDIVASVKVEGEGAETGSTNEPIFIMDTDTYGFEFPNFVTGIIIPNGATTIGKNVFGGYPNLQTIVIPESVTSIGQSAFYACSSLTSITIPEGVTSIGISAFQNCSGLTSITIPEGVTSISDCAFFNCSGLTSITIPEGVTSIGERAFYKCSNLATINYTGTEEQWNAISKDSGWNDGCPSDVVIHLQHHNNPLILNQVPTSQFQNQYPPKYKAVKDYYITGRNTENTAEPNEDDEIINGWYVPRINLEHIHYKFIGADSINGLGIFAVVADAGYFIGEDGFARMIEDDGVSDEIDYKTGFYIPVNEQTEDSSYVALGNWYVAYENSHIVDGECENGYRLYEDKYAVPDISYMHIYLSKFCELEGVCIFVETVDQRYSIKNGGAVMIEEAEELNKINYITGYWKLP